MWKANSSLSKTTGLICRKYCRFKHNPSQRDIQAATVFVANTQNSIQGRMFTSVQCRILLSLRHSPCHCGIRALPQGPNEVFTHLLKNSSCGNRQVTVFNSSASACVKWDTWNWESPRSNPTLPGRLLSTFNDNWDSISTQGKRWTVFTLMTQPVGSSVMPQGPGHGKLPDCEPAGISLREGFSIGKCCFTET